MLTDTLKERTIMTEDCWLWSGAKDGGGYGMISIGGRMFKTHRLVWEIANGTIPKGLQVCHSCDNPSCCNPDHLFLGTHRDNMQDKVRKGRPNGGGGWEKIRGEGNGSAKLTQSQIDEMRILHSQGISERKLATKFGISKSQAHRIIARQSWK
jgi:hypothetical protein